MYPLRAELRQSRVATTKRMGEGLKSSTAAESAITPSFTGRGQSLAVAMVRDCCQVLGLIGLQPFFKFLPKRATIPPPDWTAGSK